jgi:pimeloyl-ACP methyl ester carboxylesterase
MWLVAKTLAQRILKVLPLVLVLQPCSATTPCGAGNSEPGERWKTLPPTPSLPHPEREGGIAVEGARIWYGEYGVTHDGVPVLLLHGGLANSAYYGRLIPELVTAGYHVIAMDSRGHGRSTRSLLPYSYELMARDVRTVLDSLAVRAADVVGWSDGGTIGYELAMTAPDRVHRLFAFGANTSLTGLKPNVAAQTLFARYIRRAQQEYRSIAVEPGGYPRFLTAISHMWAAEPNWSDSQLKAIRIPVTVALAQHDEGVRISHAEHIADTIPDANLTVLPDVSHFAMLQCPAQFDQAVLDFLRWR